MGTQLKQLTDAGQSIWLDNIRRSMFASGELHGLIVSGLRGMTSNPTIFEKAIGSGNDYDAQLASLIGSEHDPNHLFEALAIDDIRHACDEFRDLYESTNGGDGFVSLEVSPLLASDTKGTVDAAARLWKMVDRPNVMIKIPSTPECISAVTDTIAAGINVNITLIFSLETYEDVANAYIAGLERRVAAGGSIERIASVASVFVSRIDTAVDKLIEDKAKGQPSLRALLGKTGVANMKLIYARYKKLFEGERFEKLKAAGGRVQRPLWASTGVKNPAYSDLLYVETLVGKNTVNTLPPATLDALVDHGTVRADTVESDLGEAHATVDALAAANISIFDVTQKLQADGVASFADSYNAMLGAIASKQKQLGGKAERVAISLGKDLPGADAAIERLASDDFLAKLWKHDPEPWSSDPAHTDIIKNALGWLDFPKTVHGNAADLAAFANEMRKIYTHAVVLGMGGSSLAPDVLRETFGHVTGYPQLHVLDSSDPVQVARLEASLDLAHTLFVVASKSGTTTEPEAFFRYFYERVQKTVGADSAGKQFVAITDPDTQLGKEAKEAGFVRIFENDPAIGGRYSALSYFGMVPAALAGYDVATILDRGLGELAASDRSTKVADSEAVRFGATIGTLAKNGRDKLTIVAHPEVAAFGAWAEQLVAESTGKSGTGIVPIEGETLGMPSEYGSDRVFVYVGAGLPADEHLLGAMDGGAIETRLHMLEEAGHPVIRLGMNDRLDIGEQFALWEVAVATAGAVLGIDAFDQPNVQESKDNTKRLLAEYKKTGSFPEPEPKQTTDVARVIPISGSKDIALGADLSSALGALLAQRKHGDYVAFTAYIDRSPDHERQLLDIRLKVRDALKVATTVGFGPRFLHSTGQLHKGGPNTGIFFQITADTNKTADLQIPGMVTFATLIRAQALGDFESLDKRDRRGLRLHLSGPLDLALEAVSSAIDDAVSAHA
ncbi:MAG: bifunctional transaldolase/phosoglucose isomerase [Candidatus Eremiobacteraeota bacterium]|nr:bifunctional transaldolase/phosoglucose isomerase [Candidatus Eremiobacteraeota bacterium]